MTDSIRSIRPEWTLVMDRLIQVTLHVGRWRAATRSEFQEYGLDAAAFRAYTAGTRRLLPERLHKELEMLERMARDLQDFLSYRTMFGYLMPKEVYEEYRQWIEQKPAAELRAYLHHKKDAPPSWQTASLKQRWFALGSQIAAQRDAIVDEMVGVYRESAIVRWRVDSGFAKTADVQPPDEWLDATLAAMVRRIPTADDIRLSFALDIIPAFVEAPDEAVKAAKLEDIARQEADVQRRLTQLSDIQIEAEREKARLALDVKRERLQRERRITEEVAAHEKKLRQERIEKTLDAVAGQLHGLVYGAVVDGLSMIKDKGRVHPRWVGRVKTLVDQVRVLNFTEDAELKRVCTELERLAEDGAASPASATRMRESLVQVGISLKADLVAGSMPSRSARELGIPDHPMPDLVRQARRQARPDLFTPLESKTDPAVHLERAARTLEPAAAGA